MLDKDAWEHGEVEAFHTLGVLPFDGLTAPANNEQRGLVGLANPVWFQASSDQL